MALSASGGDIHPAGKHKAHRRRKAKGDGTHPHPHEQVFAVAPNFSLYIVDTTVVCFYSEHRKFFLHGELFVSLASAIASGSTYWALLHEMLPGFPPEMVKGALQRLVDRRFVIPVERLRQVAAAPYWASIGLSLGAAERNLAGVRVRVETLAVSGEAELCAALSDLGVRLVNRSADLTVTLVSDYLEASLAARNRERVGRKSWLPVQLPGIAPLVGPLFRVEGGPCWACLADRMKWNREVKAFLDRTGARRLIASPLTAHMVGQSAAQFAALEIAKAIATNFQTDLCDHIISFDLLGSTIARHYVAARPQCVVCGRQDLRDPSRAPAPLELHTGGKVVITSGGYRTVSPAATLARYRKHVSPLTGVVSRIEPLDADLSLNTSYLAIHNFSPRPSSVGELTSGVSSESYGKGSTAEQAQVSALMEAIERYSGIFQGDEIRVRKRYLDFAPGEAIAPNDVMLFSKSQYARDVSRDDANTVPANFDPSLEMDWSPVWSLRDECLRYLPTSLLYYFYAGPGDDQTTADSNGCAAGNTIEEAIVQGFLELVERDAYAIWWYNRLSMGGLDLNQVQDSYILDLQLQLTEADRRLWVLDITSDLGIPTFVAISHWKEGKDEFIEFGSGAHFDTRIAALRAITELNQFFSITRTARRNSRGADFNGSTAWRLEEHLYLLPNGEPKLRPDFSVSFATLDKREQVLACMQLARQQGLDFLVLNQTRPDIEVPVVRVLVPGLRHFYRRFGPGRLYDVPVKLGFRNEPLSEGDLNPLFPPT
jgi:oxazoline/thiazoline synthase